jgi:hypothetical protein
VIKVAQRPGEWVKLAEVDAKLRTGLGQLYDASKSTYLPWYSAGIRSPEGLDAFAR